MPKNIFDEVMADYHANDFKLGMPSTDIGHYDRRLTLMRHITGGKGFRQDAKEPATRGTTGKTRGQLKREARDRANAAVDENRSYQFLHSAARRRVLEAEVLQVAA